MKTLFKPDQKQIEHSNMMDYMRFLKQNQIHFDDYVSMHEWSIKNIEVFWESIVEYFNVSWDQKPTKTLSQPNLPFAKWFDDGQLNFARHLLNPSLDKPNRVVIESCFEDGSKNMITGQNLLDQVSVMQQYLMSVGVGKNDRVAGIVPNTHHPIVCMLACNAIGAVWSSCSLDFGEFGLLDRLNQVDPKVLMVSVGYVYNLKKFNRIKDIQSVINHLKNLKSCLMIENSTFNDKLTLNHVVSYNEIMNQYSPKPIHFEALPFNHPLYIMFSSGTTSKPKCIVHGQGGTLLQHLKELSLHTNLKPTDRFMYYTTTGWMMHNWMVSSLALGVQLLLYEGSPTYPTTNGLWTLAQREKLTVVGTSAKYISLCKKECMKLNGDFSNMHTILSTGSVLVDEDYDWVYENIKHVILMSIAGGTDILSCFFLGNPMLPVIRGRLQCIGLGMDVRSFDEQGNTLIDEVGELVCVQPSPSMPIYFLNDQGNQTYKKSYFDKYPNVWHHGDFVKITKDKMAIIYGRSDATINRFGVRMGTSEIYRVVQEIDEVLDSLVVSMGSGNDEKIYLFVVLKKEQKLDNQLIEKIKSELKTKASFRHVPDVILAIAEVPYTVSGKKVELLVKRILEGKPYDNKEALKNPSSLDEFIDLGRESTGKAN